MGYNRPQSKWLARDAMRGAYPHPMLVSLVYLLLTSVLGNVVMSFVSNPFDAAYYYLTQTNYPVDEIMSAIFTPSRMAVLLLMELLLNLYFWVMRYGYTSYCLRLTRREGPSYRNLLDGFYSMGRALGVNFLVALFQFLWGLIGVAVYVVFVLWAYFWAAGWLFLWGLCPWWCGISIFPTATGWRFTSCWTTRKWGCWRLSAPAGRPCGGSPGRCLYRTCPSLGGRSCPFLPWVF